MNNKNVLRNLTTLTISVFADPSTGAIASLGVGESQIANLPRSKRG